jgi:LCP family protein required for cell wall assembly
MSKNRSILLIILICVVGGLVAGYLYLNPQMDKPLGPTIKGRYLEGPALNFDQSMTIDQTSTHDQISLHVQESPQNQTDELRPLCGKVPVLTVLVLGIDNINENYLYGLADSTRIVRIDFTTHKVSALTLERDTWVKIPGISDHGGITEGKLNQAYFYGSPGMEYFDGPGEGAGLVAATLKYNFDVDVDNYLVVNMAAFEKVIDAIGGIDVYLPYNVNGVFTMDTGYVLNRGYYPAGMNHLNGKQAMELARIRLGYTTIFRNENQDRIFRAIFHKISTPDIILKGPQLVQILSENVLTDLSPRQIGNMICLASKMNNDDVSFTRIPASHYVQGTAYIPGTKDETFAWDIDYDYFRSYIKQFMNGEVP